MLYLLEAKLFPVNIVITVETAVNTVILAVISYIKRGEYIDSIAKMLPGLLLGFSGHLFQKRRRCRRKQGFKVFYRTSVMAQRPFHILFSVAVIIIFIHLPDDFLHNVGADLFHPFNIFHVICPERRIRLQSVFSFQSGSRQLVTVHEIYLILFIHHFFPPV